jgi:hypothetical protein
MSRSRRRQGRGRFLLWIAPFAAAVAGAESFAEPACGSVVQTPDAFMDAFGAY